MFDSLFKDLKYQWTTGNFWVRSIGISVAIFVMLNLVKALFTFQNNGIAGVVYDDIIHSISMSSNWKSNLIQFWVWLTHIYVHEGFFHLLWNMLWLYWFANIVEDLIGARHAKFIFFESAFCGGLFFVIAAQWIPWYQHSEVHAYGASAAVNGMLFAAATISPGYTIRLVLIGDVQIKYIALVVLILDLLFAGQQSNTGGHFAHLGGALWGYLYVILLRRGISMDFTSPLKKKEKTRIRKNIRMHKPNTDPPAEDRLNKILDKIHQHGIQSLSSEEKQFLDQKSKES